MEARPPACLGSVYSSPEEHIEGARTPPLTLISATCEGDLILSVSTNSSTLFM